MFYFGYDLLQFGVLVLLSDTDYLTLGVDYFIDNCFISWLVGDEIISKVA